MTAYILDTETTGQSEAELEAIELAYAELKLSDGPLRYGTICHSLYRPALPILPVARATHHILDEELIGKPPSAEARLPADAEYLVAHNADYDWAAIGKPEVKRICTLALSRRFFPERSHKLGAMIYSLLEQHEAKLLLAGQHSAKSDLRCCAIILAAILEALPKKIESWEELYEISEEAREPLVWGFGRYVGKPLEETPASYVSWALLNMKDIDPYLRRKLVRIAGADPCKAPQGSQAES